MDMGFWRALEGVAGQVFGTGGPLLVLALAASAVLAVAFRKRRDVDVVEMQKRITDLTTRVETLEAERVEDRAEMQTLRDTLVERDRVVFILRSTLARNGLADPTTSLESA